jgi:phenylacetate-coenzyme A ligase PaaK-like adenylate-forming protein
MNMNFRQRIFRINGEDEFQDIALGVFKYQAINNTVYHEYIKLLGINPDSVKSSFDIPFLPVTFFRNHKVTSGTGSVEAIFESSGTTGMETSRHYISDISLYEESFVNVFRYFYGEPSDYIFAALLPSYSERKGSSLVYMMTKLIERSTDPRGGFYKNNPEKLIRALTRIKTDNKKAILLGVSFALLDLAEKYSPDLSGIIVMETGGMKGKRKEVTRQEVHAVLKSGFNLKSIHSEYGMTELLSQAYSSGEGVFYCPPWMKEIIRDPQDPLTVINQAGKTGGINVIDLANFNSCSFIATSDIGKMNSDGGFEVLGRFDNSDIRGCSLLFE